jgi:hypothetical protein
MGFIPVIVGNHNNNIAQTIISEEQAVQKVQIFGNNNNTSRGIDFKFTVPFRSYVNDSTISYNDLEYFAYDKSNLNNISNLNCSSTDKYEIRSTLSKKYLPLKTDEEYTEDLLNSYPDILDTSHEYITLANIAEKNSHISMDNIAKIKIL